MHRVIESWDLLLMEEYIRVIQKEQIQIRERTVSM